MAKLTQDQVRKIIMEAPPGTTPEGIVAALRKEGHTLEGYLAPKPKGNFFAQHPGGFAGLARHAPALSAAAGGLAGGLIGGPPGALVGAGLGGMYGQSVKSTSEVAAGAPPPSLLETAGSQVQAGVGGTRDEAMGMGLGAAIKPVAKFTMARALGVGKKLRESFPEVDIPQAVLNAKNPIGKGITDLFRGGKGGGLEKAEAAREAAATALEDLYAKASAAGTKITHVRLTDSIVRSVEQTLAKQGRQMTFAELGAARKAVTEWVKTAFTRQNLGIIPGKAKLNYSPSEVKNIKQLAQGAAKEVYDAIANHQLIDQTTELAGRRAAGIAAGSRAALERSVHGAAESEAKSQAAIAVERAIREASEPAMPNFLSRIPLFLLIRYGLVPSVVSRGALAMNSGATSAALRQVPRTISDLMSSH